ncbi:thioesterase family protein [Amorphus sp. 3PC139-8]|uniref:thioesterase family protein n=1 Tax=Amorphus sp. 3PC139-8 TaxID=2735676 RepID=UPI00345DD829
MPALETLVSFVNSWECDENAHLNVQFYFSRFEIAAAHFAAMAGLDPALAPVARHVRYHAELVEGDILRMESGIVTDGPLAPGIVHSLIDISTGRVSATAWHRYPATATPELAARAEAANAAIAPEPARIAPRGVTGDIPAPQDRAALFEKGAVITSRGIIQPADVDADGVALDRTIVGHFSDGASALWEAIGLTKTKINERGWGRVAVEMRLVRHERLAVGDLVEQVSGIVTASERTLWMRHCLFETRSGRPLAIGDSISIAMDLAARKAVRFPGDVIAAIPLIGGADT